jgi:cbb3-type cytochrome oxidase maturation protein
MMFRLSALAVPLVAALAAPAAALAHDAPENKQSRWVMVDWMLETFFVFAALALVAFLWAWKAGHFHNLDQAARVPLEVDEEDYYTPEWAFDEEEWNDADR